MNRREFLETSIAAAGLARLLPAAVPGQVDIPDQGWRLWLDKDAAWKDDAIFLPEDVVLDQLPAKPPTGGWDALGGISVNLPATVEQFHWGADGLRPYQGEYRFEADDHAFQNGAYYGVSWWWREVEIPAGFRGKTILLHVRGARQRAEVYLNRQLVGYSILEELPFECDLTRAARPGERNVLAIRITNPGGRFDWVDRNTITWGKVSFQKSHGFGGLDRGLTLTAHGPVRIADAWVLNTADPRSITCHAELHSEEERSGTVRFSVAGMASQAVSATVKPGLPATVEYILQNEASIDLKNPGLERILRKMQALDPSRTIVSNDGFASRAAQAWLEPYQERLHTSADGGAGGWWDEHSGQASDVWRDSFYNGPNDFLFRSTDRTEIVEFGEMKGAASIDDHAHLIRQIQAHGGKSYDLADHRELLGVYDRFLDAHGFREAFPTASDLFQSIGRRAYETWAQFMENIRICDAVDYAAISGWESTAIENHSGLVDNFRDFKSDPKVLANALATVHPVAKQRHIAVAAGEAAAFDLYLLNDSGRPVSGELAFTIIDPGGKETQVGRFPCPKYVPDQLSYLVAENVATAPLKAEGIWRTSLKLVGSQYAAHVREIYVVNTQPTLARALRIGTASLPASIAHQLEELPGLTLEPFAPGKKFDVIVASAPSAVETAAVTTDDVGADRRTAALAESALAADVLAAFQAGTPLLAVATNDDQAAGIGKQLAAAGILRFDGMVGASRASWMGTWYFVRRHPIYAGLPVNRAMSIEYQVRGSDSNGLVVDGPGVEIVAAYSRDHDRRIGAGTFTVKTEKSRMVVHRITGMHAVSHQRLLANAVRYLAG